MRRSIGGLWALGIVLLVLPTSVARAESRPAVPLAEVTDVAMGRRHTCALTGSGIARCWGGNETGQLGLGDSSTVTVRVYPVVVPGLPSNLLDIGSGDEHSCAITAARGLKCWGLNGAGALGSDSELYQIPSPVDVIGLQGPVTAFSGGAEHSCALLSDGRVQCWGSNSRGQLGDGSNSDRRTAILVQGLPASALRISGGGVHSCAQLSNGETWCWGANEFGQLGDNSTQDRNRPVKVQALPSGGRDLASAYNANCAVSASGAVHCWGAQYPLLAFDADSLIAQPYPGFEQGFQSIAAGTFHFCALRSDGAVKCLGDGNEGQFGNGPIDGSLGTDLVVGLADDIVAVAAGGHHSCARADSGGLQCWGLNTEGQLGNGQSSRRAAPTPVADLDSGVAKVSTGGFFSCALTQGGGVKCWGYNGANQLGDGTDLFRYRPVDVLGLTSGVLALATGDSSACAIKADRSVVCWGANYSGALGNGDTLNRATPEPVLGLDSPALAIAMGREHGCAILQSGGIKCWGQNDFGQLGDGSLETRLTAVSVQGLAANPTAIAAGYYHTCASVSSGMQCWGANEFGQLGVGDRNDRLRPTSVQGISSPPLQIDAGIVHTCALNSNGAVQCWGYASFGSLLGDGSEQDRLVPGPVPTLQSGVAQVALGAFHSCARLQNGAMLCWGQGGTVGDNTLLSRSLPTPVAGLNRNVQHIDAGFGNQSCAVVGGAARCWGENSFAQLGDGTAHGIPLPQTVLQDEFGLRVDPIVANANGSSAAPRFDASGRYAVFESRADNLVAGDQNGVSDIFRLDTESGEVVRVSQDDAGGELNGASSAPTLSDDAELIVFVAPANAAQKLAGESAEQRAARLQKNQGSLLLRSMQTGSTQAVPSTGLANPGTPTLAASGNNLAFSAEIQDPQQGTVGQRNVYVVPIDRSTAVPSLGAPQCVTCMPLSSTGQVGSTAANGASESPALSADGQWLAYQTQASNSISDSPSPCPTGTAQILLRNMQSGQTQRVSPPSGTPSSSCANRGSAKPSISYDGAKVAFESDQPLIEGDANGVNDVYLWQSGDTALKRISTSARGNDTSAAAYAASLSGNGKHLVFVSEAGNHDLSSTDNNEVADVHSVALDEAGSITRLSRTSTGSEISAASTQPSVNYDGSLLAFSSAASNLGASIAGQTGVYVRGNPSAPPKRSAAWWIPAESGWGVHIFDQGNLLAPMWFTYDHDGEPTWFLIGGARANSNGSFGGEVFRFTGTPFAEINGPATRSATPIGQIQLNYFGESRMRFDYQIEGVNQSKTLQRFPFASRDIVCATAPNFSRSEALNYSDLWTGNEDNAGWGFTLYHFDSSLVAVWYTYDLDGEAVFFVVSTQQTGPARFSGEVYRQRNGTPFSAIDGSLPSSGGDLIGTARFDFIDGELADFSYEIGGVSQTRQIRRLLVGSEASVCRVQDGRVP
ncbi:PD40 domain-containing protein [Pseudomarimonas arenosa]|uniref:PD40 domain-containing protein n=1 Tax=Pseudomarimonas arenosa TaxID=2774145 RepID=A0AAW3ZRD2_9GAMM|nr:PD40 domain-containing protein [Pseudomarimonas arenosa]MBD8528263.1 PD40 domain-containing protein [Pseudomarimonas arenosa]